MTSLGELAGHRWAAERDLTDAAETLAVDALLADAERSRGPWAGSRTSCSASSASSRATPALRDTLANRQGDRQAKALLVYSLLEGKVAPQTLRLARQCVLGPAGRQLDQTIDEYLQRAAIRRQQLTAVVTAVAPLSAEQEERLAEALKRIYGKDVLLQVVIDPGVMGGIRVQVGDEVVDGTIAAAPRRGPAAHGRRLTAPAAATAPPGAPSDNRTHRTTDHPHPTKPTRPGRHPRRRKEP